MNKLIKIASLWALSLVILALSLWFYALGKSDRVTAEWFAVASILLGVYGSFSGAGALAVTIVEIICECGETKRPSVSCDRPRGPPPPNRNI